MPRCYNDSKTVSSVNNGHKHSADDIVLTQTRAFSIGNQLEVDEDSPIVERSHRRLRCDLSPVPTNTHSHLNIKLLSLKVWFARIYMYMYIHLYVIIYLALYIYVYYIRCVHYTLLHPISYYTLISNSHKYPECYTAMNFAIVWSNILCLK